MARRKQYPIADGSTAFPNITADGNYPVADASGLTGFNWEGGKGTVLVGGTPGGGTYKLQILLPDGSWADVGTPVTFTAGGAGNFECCAGRLRLNVAGSTAASMRATVAGIPTNNAG